MQLERLAPTADARGRVLGHNVAKKQTCARPHPSHTGKRLYVFASPDVDARDGIPGVVVATRVRCGKPTCRCQQGAAHGPYHYHRWREVVVVEQQGQQDPTVRHHRRYVDAAEVPRVRALCQRWWDQHRAVPSARAVIREFNRLWGEFARALQ